MGSKARSKQAKVTAWAALITLPILAIPLYHDGVSLLDYLETGESSQWWAASIGRFVIYLLLWLIMLFAVVLYFYASFKHRKKRSLQA